MRSVTDLISGRFDRKCLSDLYHVMHHRRQPMFAKKSKLNGTTLKSKKKRHQKYDQAEILRLRALGADAMDPHLPWKPFMQQTLCSSLLTDSPLIADPDQRSPRLTTWPPLKLDTVKPMSCYYPEEDSQTEDMDRPKVAAPACRRVTDPGVAQGRVAHPKHGAGKVLPSRGLEEGDCANPTMSDTTIDNMYIVPLSDCRHRICYSSLRLWQCGEVSLHNALTRHWQCMAPGCRMHAVPCRVCPPEDSHPRYPQRQWYKLAALQEVCASWWQGVRLRLCDFRASCRSRARPH